MSDKIYTRQEFLGLSFDPVDINCARRAVVSRAGGESFHYVVTPNVDHIVGLDRSQDPQLLAAYEGAALCLCDSRILARLAAFADIRLPVVPGSDLTRDLLGYALPRGRIAVIGGDPLLHAALEQIYPRFEWLFHAPPMGLRRNADARTAVGDFVVSSEADVILFAVGAPQSELLCAEIAARGGARGVALCIGASLEFLTGAKRRAPRWMQRASLEWLFRLLSEPRRLWRRYLVEGPRIFAIWQRWRTARASRDLSGSTPSAGA